MQRVLLSFESHVLIYIFHFYTVILLTLLNIDKKDLAVTQSVESVIVKLYSYFV